jgi:hypothetical protein
MHSHWLIPPQILSLGIVGEIFMGLRLSFSCPVGGAVHEDNCLDQNALTFRMTFELYFHHSGCKFLVMLTFELLEVVENPVTVQKYHRK